MPNTENDRVDVQEGDDALSRAQVDFSFLDLGDIGHRNLEYGGLVDLPQEEMQDSKLQTDWIGKFPEPLLGLNMDEDFEESDGTELPEWACAFCGIHNPASVVKCLSTGKWFCNGRSINSASCIVTHLVKSRLKEVCLHRMSPLGEIVLECYATGSRNVFALGFIPLPDENTVVLLSRDIPASHPAIKDLNLDISEWQPLIQDRSFVDWLVKHPSTEELRCCKRLTLAEASKLEDLWKNGDTTATLDDLAHVSDNKDDVLPVALHYEDASMYETIFGGLIHLEAEYDRAIKESQIRENVRIQWSIGLNKRYLARFNYPKDSIDSKIMIGDELRIRHACPSLGSPPWECVGTVIRLDSTSEEIHVEIHPASKRRRKRFGKKRIDRKVEESDRHQVAEQSDPPTSVEYGYLVECVWRGVSYERMERALRSFVADETSVSGYLYHRILGQSVPNPSLRAKLPRRLSAPGLPELNHSQMDAVRRVLGQPLSLIQGPPGTGKTVTSATIVYHLSRQDQGQVLVAAPSNIAVDHLADRVSMTGLRVVRLLSKSREEVGSSVEHLTLQYQVQHLEVPAAAELRKLQSLKNDIGELSDSDERKYRSILRALEHEVLHAADVVCVTCVGAGDPRLSDFRFRRVLIDEATQAVEPEALIPMVMGCKQLVMVGDHCQLGPVILNKKAVLSGLGESLFERLMFLGVRPIRLAVQYRMHPALSLFPSNMFYEGALQNGVSADERSNASTSFPWPSEYTPMIFWAQFGAEEISSSGTSYLNRAEASAVEKTVTHFLKHGVEPSQIGVITPYEGQRAHVVSVMTRVGPLNQSLYNGVEIASVDSFQGREKDYIILSCVRSNEHQGIGFLSDPRRLNVALTRARYGLIIVGNPKVLCRQAIWSALIHHFRDEDVLVEGTLNNLKPSMISLGKPRKFGAFGLGTFGMNMFRPVEHGGSILESSDRAEPARHPMPHSSNENPFDIANGSIDAA